MVVLRCGMQILYADGAMDRADSAAAWAGRSATARPASGRAAWNEAGGIADGAAIPVERRNKLWRSTSSGGRGARNLVGAAVGVACGVAWDDAFARRWLQVDCQTARLCQPNVRP